MWCYHINNLHLNIRFNCHRIMSDKVFLSSFTQGWERRKFYVCGNDSGWVIALRKGKQSAEGTRARLYIPNVSV